jgi:hypothetical protein
MKTYKCLVKDWDDPNWDKAVEMIIEYPHWAAVSAAKQVREDGYIIDDDCDYIVFVMDARRDVFEYAVRCNLVPVFNPRRLSQYHPSIIDKQQNKKGIDMSTLVQDFFSYLAQLPEYEKSGDGGISFYDADYDTSVTLAPTGDESFTINFGSIGCDLDTLASYGCLIDELNKCFSHYEDNITESSQALGTIGMLMSDLSPEDLLKVHSMLLTQLQTTSRPTAGF